MFALYNTWGSVTPHIHVTTRPIVAYSRGCAAASFETFEGVKQVHAIGQTKPEWVSKALLF